MQLDETATTSVCMATRLIQLFPPPPPFLHISRSPYCLATCRCHTHKGHADNIADRRITAQRVKAQDATIGASGPWRGIYILGA